MAINIITSYQIAQVFKTSKYFRQNLGLVITVDKSGRRDMNRKDEFAFFYQNQYRTTIYAQGNVGDVKFYVDHLIKDDTFALYTGDTFEEFLYTFDKKLTKEKGIDHYIGFLLKDVDLKYEEKVKNEELRKLEPVSEGDPEKVFTNPGSVTYADVKAYLEKKQKERYKNNFS
jgi:hypothetical protein